MCRNRTIAGWAKQDKGFTVDRIVEVQSGMTQWVYRTDSKPQDVAKGFTLESRSAGQILVTSIGG